MADTTTISDLTEKQTLVDTDKILVEDTNGVGQALLGSAITDKINGALAYQTKTNANACIPTTEGKTEQFQVNNANDTPDKRPCIIVAKMEKQTSYYNLYQELISYDANSKVVKYIRYGYSTNKTNWTFGNWEKIATESEISNYKKIETREVTATVDVNGNINTPLTDLFSIVSVSGSNKMYIPFKYSTYWVLYCMNVGGSKVASGTELTVTIKYFQN